ncbi:hypothetical protein BCV70DRAFT_77449 [Testicularia cyperi]|uniref:Uncharacterized protein n=1 Tax=Testicularia cyperi TaxID=1882483 RepID=A0A317XTE1_9BASI|nr:hypothetical protein BCV70DRAFT_77449 [Testicularia cyperi]
MRSQACHKTIGETFTWSSGSAGLLFSRIGHIWSDGRRGNVRRSRFDHRTLLCLMVHAASRCLHRTAPWLARPRGSQRQVCRRTGLRCAPSRRARLDAKSDEEATGLQGRHLPVHLFRRALCSYRPGFPLGHPNWSNIPSSSALPPRLPQRLSPVPTLTIAPSMPPSAFQRVFHLSLVGMFVSLTLRRSS